jgi:hypothetical protein
MDKIYYALGMATFWGAIIAVAAGLFLALLDEVNYPAAEQRGIPAPDMRFPASI